MKKTTLIITALSLLIVAVLIISGFKGEITGGAITCNTPYILVGNDCCMDSNDNQICDKDETEPDAEPVELPREETTTIVEEPKTETPKEETTTLRYGEYLVKEGEAITFGGKEIVIKDIDLFQETLMVVIEVDGMKGEIYDTKNARIINGLEVQALKYERLKHAVLLQVIGKPELGPNEYFVDTRTVLKLPGKPEIKVMDIFDDGEIILHIVTANALDKIDLDKEESITVQGMTITNLGRVQNNRVKIERYVIIKVQ